MSTHSRVDDGKDAFKRDRRQKRKTNPHKSKQICQRAYQVLRMAIPAELPDPLLIAVEVVDVIWDKSGQTLLVQIHRTLDSPADDQMLLTRLNGWEGKLRTLLAHALSRKRVPRLRFVFAEHLIDGGYRHAH